MHCENTEATLHLMFRNMLWPCF